MKTIYCIICCKYYKFKKPKISHIFKNTLILSIVCSKCENKDEKIYKEQDSIETLEIVGIIKNI